MTYGTLISWSPTLYVSTILHFCGFRPYQKEEFYPKFILRWFWFRICQFLLFWSLFVYYRVYVCTMRRSRKIRRGLGGLGGARSKNADIFFLTINLFYSSTDGKGYTVPVFPRKLIPSKRIGRPSALQPKRHFNSRKWQKILLTWLKNCWLGRKASKQKSFHIADSRWLVECVNCQCIMNYFQFDHQPIRFLGKDFNTLYHPHANTLLQNHINY